MKKALLVLSIVSTIFSAQAQTVTKIGVAAEPYPPFSTKSADGTWSGFEIDLIHQVCKQAKLTCEIKDIAWDGIIPSLQSKKIDVIFSSMSVTDERSKKVLFTSPYYSSIPLVLGQEGQDFELTKEAMKNKIIGVQTSTVSAFYIEKKIGRSRSIRHYDTQDAVNADLLAGRIDFMISDNIMAAEFFKNNKEGLQSYGTVEYDPVLGEGVAGGVRLDDTKLKETLSKAIDSVVKSENYEALSMKYFGTNIAP
ncbi:transporter substrate-binding domain-containing protein [Psychromonas sp. KJ10-2]|uniref:transporter substrate-binding domain-containing protein n=1 Tax=Psychromonas sp. KJ10-2 TaxID=3391822 RepID=UPI0039B3AC14